MAGFPFREISTVTLANLKVPDNWCVMELNGTNYCLDVPSGTARRGMSALPSVRFLIVKAKRTHSEGRDP